MSFWRAGYFKMAGDHGNVHIINNKAAWNAKLEETKNSNKVVSTSGNAPDQIYPFKFVCLTARVKG